MSRANPLDVACRLVTTARKEKPQDLREVAGVLALLNLLGIVDAFYGETTESAAGKPQTVTGAVSATGVSGPLASAVSPVLADVTGGGPLASECQRDQEAGCPSQEDLTGAARGAATTSAGTPSETPALPCSGASVVGDTGAVSREPSPQLAAGGARGPADVASNLLSSLVGTTARDKGLDPKLITSLVGLLARASAQKTASGEETAQGAGAEADKEKASLAALFDPKFITLVLNLLAALNKPGGEAVAEGRKDGQSRSSAPAGAGATVGTWPVRPEPSDESGSEAERSPGKDIEVSVDSNGVARFRKPSSVSRSMSRASEPVSRLFGGPGQTRGHKPGHAILKSPFITPRRPSYLDGKG